MVQLAIVIFFGLFAVVEIYQSVKNIQLPLPIYLGLGIVLAVVSNLSVLSNSSITKLPSEVLPPPDLVAQQEAEVIPSVD
jgi:hypothetical protein